jgi:hypothetical protein
MSIFNVSRSISLWLIIVIFSFIYAPAQDSTDNTAEPAKNSQKESANQLTLYKSNPNKVKLLGDANLPDVKADITNKYQNEVKSSNKEWGYYGGSYTFHKDLKGESQKAPVVLFGIRHAWTTKNNSSHRLRYYMDLNPLIIVNYRQRRLIQTSPTTTAIVGDRKTVFGVGFVPLGLQFNWRNSKKIQPFIAGGMGVALFNKKFPDNRSALEPDRIGNRFQIMPEFGAGVEIRNSENKSYFIGYKYHHMSNGYTAPLNVGYNTNMLYFGTYLQRGK